MSDDGIWATEAEILSSAALFETDVVIYCNMGDKLAWSRYRANILKPTLRNYKQERKSIYLINDSGVHIDYVVDVS